MRLTLTASNHPELEPIRLTEGVLPIGRKEPPFADYPAELSAQLSARHARVFLEQDNFYISDLGSRNGSRLNGKPVGENPKLIRAGDVVSLGDLQFIAGIDEEGHTGGVPPELILEPVNQDSALPRLVISRYPLLIGKNSEPMVQYGQQYPRELLFLSRRHAHLYARGGRVYVEDLGSTNGTYVSSQRLTDTPHCLEAGETLAFGGDFFIYRVGFTAAMPEDSATDTLPTSTSAQTQTSDEQAAAQASQAAPQEPPQEPPRQAPRESSQEPPQERPQEPVQESAAAAEPAEKPKPTPPPERETGKTTFVSSPTSFLEIFCSEEEEGAAADAEPSPHAKSARPAAEKAEKGDAKASRRWMLPLAALAVIGLVVAAIYLYPQGREQQLKELIKSQRLAEAAELGNQWLAADDDKRSLQPLATEALIRYVAAPWMERIEEQAFDRATEVLQTALPMSSNNPVGAEMLEILDWAGRVDAFHAAWQASGARIRLFQDEGTIRDLVDYWEANQIGNQRMLDRITAYVPDFSEYSSRAQSHLRALRTAEAQYLDPIDDLNEAIENGLRESAGAEAAARDKALDTLSRRFARFADKYPKVTGLAPLRQDLADYRTLARLLETRDLQALSAHLQATPPKTPPFRRHLSWMQDRHLPSETFVAAYARALAAWQSGETDQAMAALEPLQADDWQGLAKNRFEHFKGVDAAYRKLETQKTEPGHGERVVAFFRMLDDGDDHYRKLLADDFAAQRKTMLQLASQALSEARQAWDAYRDQGGIDGGLRIQNKLSDAFKTLADRLMQALRKVNEGDTLYGNLGEPLEPAAASLIREVRLEVKRQREWLEELSSIIGPRITQEKLSLLTLRQDEEETE